MPHHSFRLCFAASLALAVPAMASPQANSWPCDGWVVESGLEAYNFLPSAVVAGDLVVRPQRYGAPTGSIHDGALEFFRFDAQRGRFVMTGIIAFEEWRSSLNMQDVCVTGRTVALQPWVYGVHSNRCDIVELGPTDPTLSSVALSGHRLYNGRVTAAVGDTIFAVESDPFGSRIRLNVIERSSSGEWALQQTVEAWGARFNYPIEDQVWVTATEELVVVAASRLLPAEFVAVTFERTPSGQWIHAGILDRPVVGEFGRLGYVGGLALDGDRALLSFQRSWQSPVTAWLYERAGNGGWQITQAFDGPDLTTDVALGGGRLALTRNTTTELYERGATGPFDLVRRFHGLERVFHLDDTRIAPQSRDPDSAHRRS
jgi:hypothetical protein